jgi:hypothetical protein
MKSRTPIAAFAILVAALALTGCSTGGLPGVSAGIGATGPTNNYSADGLVALLMKAKAQRNLGGSIQTDSQIKSAAKPSTHGMTTDLKAEGQKLTPAGCGQLLDSLAAEFAVVVYNSSWKAATLVESEGALDLGSTANSVDALAVLAKTKGIMDQVDSKCSTMRLTDGSGDAVKFTIREVPATSNAGATFAYEQIIYAPGVTQKTVTMEAVYGNLFIGDVVLQSPNIPSMEANINAVVAAAKAG